MAWVCDDAFISARVADNFLSLRGLRWNAVERVQAYTHPLWLLSMISARCVVHDAYWSLLALGVSVSALCIWLIATGQHRPGPFIALVAGSLALSKSFVEFSTSGLENPLTHLLLVLLWRATERGPRSSLSKASVIVACAILNRLDLALLFVPPLLAFAKSRHDPPSRRALALGLTIAPLLTWEFFSLAYYGSLVPNTAIAKLTSGLPRATLVWHGLSYLLQMLPSDPLSAVLLVLGLPWGFVRGTAVTRAFCAGALAYIAYVVWIGGDFSGGRFLSAPVLVSVLSLIELVPTPRPAFQVALVATGLVLQASASTPVWTPRMPGTSCVDGVCDERAFYGSTTGWRRVIGAEVRPPHPWALQAVAWSKTPEQSRRAAGIGFKGFFAGPQVFIVDRFGLSDPLLARLPPDLTLTPWRPGHLMRCIPIHYLEAARVGPSALLDAPLRDYYARIWLVTRGEIWTLARWRAIWELNTSASRFTGAFTCEPR